MDKNAVWKWLILAALVAFSLVVVMPPLDVKEVNEDGQEVVVKPGNLSLGPADFELGIITGDRSINWILSMYIPGPDDGKVSPERARLEGMKAFQVIHATHPMIVRNREAIRLTLRFLERGTFDAGPEPAHTEGLSQKD